MTEMQRRPRKAEAALALKLSGATYDEIAEALGYVDGQACLDAVEKMLAANADDASKTKMRQIASARYERLLRAVWGKAINPSKENPEQLQAVARARELLDRHVALHGLAQPQEHIIRTPSQQELEAWVARVSAISMPKVIEGDIFEAEVVEEEAAER